MHTIAICDDDQILVERLEKLIGSIIGSEGCQLDSFFSAEQLAENVHHGYVPDILLMDICLGDENGIELVKALFSDKPAVQIIYLSSYVDYCTAVYETEHIYFLRKPVSDAELSKALKKAHESIQSRKTSIAFTSKNGTQCFIQNDILYFEGKGRKTLVHTAGACSEFNFTVAETAKKVNDSFVQCHKSFLVNLRHVSAMKNDSFIMENGLNVPISRSTRQNTQDKFFKYIGDRL